MGVKNRKKKTQVSGYQKKLSPSGRVIIDDYCAHLCTTLPSFQPTSAAYLLRLSRSLTLWEDPTETSSRRGQRRCRGGEWGAPVAETGKPWENQLKGFWKIRRFRSASWVQVFFFFGIIISAWHRIQKCGK